MLRKLAALTTPAAMRRRFHGLARLVRGQRAGSIRITQKLSRRTVVDHRNGVWVHNLDFRLHILRFGEPDRVMHPHQVVWVDVDNVQVRDAEGRPVYSQEFLIEITGRKRLEEELRQDSGWSLAAVSQVESRTTSTTFRWGSLASPNLLLKHLAADDPQRQKAADAAAARRQSPSGARAADPRPQ